MNYRELTLASSERIANRQTIELLKNAKRSRLVTQCKREIRIKPVLGFNINYFYLSKYYADSCSSYSQIRRLLVILLGMEDLFNELFLLLNNIEQYCRFKLSIN